MVISALLTVFLWEVRVVIPVPGREEETRRRHLPEHPEEL